MEGQLSHYGNEHVVEDFVAASALAPVAQLVTNGDVLDKDSVVGDLAEATFGGYAEVAAIGWTTGLVDENGNTNALTGQVVFTADVTLAGSETINGIVLLDTAKANILGFVVIDPAVVIDNVGDYVAGSLRFIPDTGVLTFDPAA